MKMKKRYELDSNGKVINLFDENDESNQNLPLIEWDFIKYPFIGSYYKIENGSIIIAGFSQEIIKQQNLILNQQRIKKLKKLLEETDWKVIVNSELIQQGLPIKYINLHQERQSWRDEINQLEKELL